jgi:hypothetical protein
MVLHAAQFILASHGHVRFGEDLGLDLDDGTLQPSGRCVHDGRVEDS